MYESYETFFFNDEYDISCFDLKIVKYDRIIFNRFEINSSNGCL